VAGEEARRTVQASAAHQSAHNSTQKANEGRISSGVNNVDCKEDIQRSYKATRGSRSMTHDLLAWPEAAPTSKQENNEEKENDSPDPAERLKHLADLEGVLVTLFKGFFSGRRLVAETARRFKSRQDQKHCRGKTRKGGEGWKKGSDAVQWKFPGNHAE